MSARMYTITVEVDEEHAAEMHDRLLSVIYELGRSPNCKTVRLRNPGRETQAQPGEQQE